jgi:hypothetical protein
MCPCGHVLQTMEQIREHWQRGHFAPDPSVSFAGEIVGQRYDGNNKLVEVTLRPDGCDNCLWLPRWVGDGKMGSRLLITVSEAPTKGGWT